MFDNIKAFTQAGGDHNEDAYVVLPNLLVCIDGATGLTSAHMTDAETDARWLSYRTAQLIAQWGGETDIDICDLLRRVAAAVKEELDAFGYIDRPGEYPSAGLSAVCIRGGVLECYVLGDCPVLLQHEAGFTLLRDETIPKRDAAVVQWMQDTARAKGVSMRKARTLASSLLLRNRQERNQQGGYWIFDPTGVGVEHGLRFRCPVSEVKRVALFSDGFWEYYDRYGLTDSAWSLLRELEDKVPAEMCARMRAVQQADADLEKYPRFKTGDDATVVYAAVGR